MAVASSCYTPQSINCAVLVVFKDSIDIPGMLCYFAVFDFGCGEMLTIRPNTDKDLLETYQSAAEHFQPRPPCRLLIGHRTPSDSHYYRDELEKLLEFLLTSRNGGYDQAIRRCLNTFLPTRRVPNRWSPLLDRDLFSFDEASILLGHHAGTDLIKFQSRQRQRVTFSLDPNARPAEELDSTLKRRTTLHFHPFLPIVLSFQMTATRQGRQGHINLHYHNS
eukprot:TRINITY_DN11105_c0_g2_i1.p2 TRINITY_DN11105_c0_g2~~TRINITY_DN11105_c0_g2_i1.p2  ORF type:complete len:221 (+),score=31.26 TRINITY_DN11105_c0_g2_i1:1198-1860(+)